MNAGRQIVLSFSRCKSPSSSGLRKCSSGRQVLVPSTNTAPNNSALVQAPSPARIRNHLPTWLVTDDNCAQVHIEEVVAHSKPQILRNIRPFSATELSLFNADPLKVATPSRKNEIIKHLWKLRINSAYRKGQNRRLVTSASVVRHMLKHTTCVFNNIFTTSRDLVATLTSDNSYRERFNRVQLIDRGILQYCLRGTTAAGLHSDTLAEAIIPVPTKVENPKLVVALDNVRYPQNIGNIIRSAVALNVDALFYLTGTADPFDWKVSHITGGLQYMLPYQTGDVRSLKRFCKSNKLTPVVAHLEGQEVDTLEIPGGICIILSNESRGPSADILKFAKKVTLPMHPLVNSLNVSIAGAILVHQLQARLYPQKA
ncbi:RNA [Babesia ovis]|uniref:RNA n=1 Tax=Babesia ovis TaxID=5869 RepID=A0A9W5TCE2_BABOV|nr:RNA [Babesia ovis]